MFFFFWGTPQERSKNTLRGRKKDDPEKQKGSESCRWKVASALASTSANVEDPPIYRMELMMLSSTHTTALFSGRRPVCGRLALQLSSPSLASVHDACSILEDACLLIYPWPLPCVHLPVYLLLNLDRSTGQETFGEFWNRATLIQ